MGLLEITILFCSGLLGTLLGSALDRYCAKRRLFKFFQATSRPLHTSDLSVKRLLEIDRRGAQIAERLQALQGLREEAEKYLPSRDQHKMIKMLNTIEKNLRKELNQYEQVIGHPNRSL
jgi:hypothetical protein